MRTAGNGETFAAHDFQMNAAKSSSAAGSRASCDCRTLTYHNNRTSSFL